MINVALIGCGYWGPNLARNLFENPNCRLVWCCDLRVGRLKVIQNRYPTTRITTDYHDILKDPSVDAVVLATPLLTHYPIAKKLLLAGKHLLVEKPFTHSVRSAAELIAIARRRHKTLMVGYTYLYSPSVRKIKSIVDSGAIGQLRYIHSTRVHFGHLKPHEGVLWDLAPHDIAVMLHWLKPSVCNVSCSGNDYFGRGHSDSISLNITSKNGPGIYIFASLVAPIKMRNMMVTGTKKMIFFNDTRSDEKIKIFDQCAVSSQPGTFEAPFNCKTGNVYSPNVSMREPLEIEIDDFIRCAERGREPISNPGFALNVVRILEAAERSLKYNRVIMGVRTC